MFKTLEEAQEHILKLEDTIKEQTEKITNFESVTKESEERIKSLQEHNQRLFLRVKQEPQRKASEEPHGLSMEDFVDKVTKGEIK